MNLQEKEPEHQVTKPRNYDDEILQLKQKMKRLQEKYVYLKPSFLPQTIAKVWQSARK